MLLQLKILTHERIAVCPLLESNCRKLAILVFHQRINIFFNFIFSFKTRQNTLFRTSTNNTVEQTLIQSQIEIDRNKKSDFWKYIIKWTIFVEVSLSPDSFFYRRSKFPSYADRKLDI